MKNIILFIILLCSLVSCIYNPYPDHPLIFEPGEIVPTPTGCQQDVDC